MQGGERLDCRSCQNLVAHRGALAIARGAAEENVAAGAWERGTAGFVVKKVSSDGWKAVCEGKKKERQ